MMDNMPKIYLGYFKHLEAYRDSYNVRCFDIKECGDEYGEVLNPSSNVVNQLMDRNKEKILAEIEHGNRDIKQLLKMISDLSAQPCSKRVMEFTFIGIRITTDCNLYGSDRCSYCDQKRYRGKLDAEKLKEIIDLVSDKGKRRGINVSLSGGEPLLLYEDLFWKGLIKAFYDHGCVINMNSNLHLITPHSVLPIINSGLASIHTSFDSSVEFVHDNLVCEGAMSRAIEGIKLFQSIKKIFHVSYPVVHINVVATKDNLLLYDKLLRFLLQYRLPQEKVGLGTPYTNSGRMDLSPHLIVLGGDKNSELQPGIDDWAKFENEVLPRCREIWNDYLNKNGISLTRKNGFDVVHYYSNPLKFSSVKKTEDKKQFRRCYIAPTQIYIVNNGDCFACGCHADAKNAPVLGNIYKDSVDDIIKNNINFLTTELPHPEYCAKCAKNTRKMNAIIENKLIAHIENLIVQASKNAVISEP